jgi:hypothetical protein
MKMCMISMEGLNSNKFEKDKETWKQGKSIQSFNYKSWFTKTLNRPNIPLSRHVWIQSIFHLI